jgi:hypothetical protein
MAVNCQQCVRSRTEIKAKFSVTCGAFFLAEIRIRPATLAFGRTWTLSPIAQLFIDWAREVAKALPNQNSVKRFKL